MPAYLSNRGKLLLMQGDWDDAGASDYLMGLIVNTSSAVPAAFDTQAEINPLNFVSDLTALSGFLEPTGGGYVRTALVRTNATEDDGNNRVNMDASDVTFANVVTSAGSTHVIGAFVYKTGASDAARALLLVGILASAISINGSGIVINIADLVRAS
jgi:hypothetical protein